MFGGRRRNQHQISGSDRVFYLFISCSLLSPLDLVLDSLARLWSPDFGIRSVFLHLLQTAGTVALITITFESVSLSVK